MSKYILILLSIGNFLGSTILYKKVAETLSPRRLNIISFFYYYFLILSFIGSILLTYNIDSFYMSSSLLYPERSMLYSWLLINLVLLITPLTMLLWKKKLPNTDNIFTEYCNSELSITEDNRRLFEGTVVLMLVGIVALIYVVNTIGIDKIPIINSFQGVGPEELAVLRQQAGRGFQGNVYVKNFLAFSIIPLMSYISFVQMIKTKEKSWVVLFIVAFLFSVFILVYDLQKAPLLRYLFTYFILIQLFMKPISLKMFRAGVLVLVTIILAFYIFITPTPINDVFSLNKGPINRVLKSQVFPTYLHMDIFPEEHDFLAGASFPSIISEKILNLEHKRSGRLVIEITRPEAVANGTGGVLNTLYVAEAFANFSWAGAILGIVWVSSLLYLAHILILKLEKTTIRVALYAYLANLLVNATQGGFIDFIYNPGLVFIIIISASLGLFAKTNVSNNDKLIR